MTLTRSARPVIMATMNTDATTQRLQPQNLNEYQPKISVDKFKQVV